MYVEVSRQADDLPVALRTALLNPTNRRPNQSQPPTYPANRLVRIFGIIEMIRWTGLAPWELSTK